MGTGERKKRREKEKMAKGQVCEGGEGSCNIICIAHNYALMLTWSSDTSPAPTPTPALPSTALRAQVQKIFALHYLKMYRTKGSRGEQRKAVARGKFWQFVTFCSLHTQWRVKRIGGGRGVCVATSVCIKMAPVELKPKKKGREI